MTTDALGFISDCMDELKIPYEYMIWTKDVTYPYAVGSYTEIEPTTEDGLEESTFMVTITTNQKCITLEAMKEKIKNFFPCEGKTAVLDNGSGIAVCYGNALFPPTGVEGLYRMQVNLKIKEWTVK